MKTSSWHRPHNEERNIKRLAISSCLFFGLPLLQAAFGSGPSARGASLIAPLYISNAEVKSVLFVANVSASSVDIRVTFQSLEAEEVGQTNVRLGPHASTTINVDNVKMAPHRFGSLGSITVTPGGSIDYGITAHVIITSRNQGNDISMEEKLQRAVETQRSIQVASVPASFSVPVLAIHSTSGLMEQVFVDCTNAHGESFQSQMTLPPGMTFLVNACISHRSEGRTYQDILRGNGGRKKGPIKIQVRSDQGSGGVAVWGFASTSETMRRSSQTAGIDFVRRRIGREFEK